MNETFTRTAEGYYYVRPGDTAQSVAKAILGDVRKAGALLNANPEIWYPDSLIIVPGVRGRLDNIRVGETVIRCINRLYPGQPTHLYQQRFYLWNGGVNRVFEGGELVFVPER